MKWWRSYETEAMMGRRERTLAAVLLRLMAAAAMLLSVWHVVNGNLLEAGAGAVAAGTLVWCAKTEGE